MEGGIKERLFWKVYQAWQAYGQLHQLQMGRNCRLFCACTDELGQTIFSPRDGFDECVNPHCFSKAISGSSNPKLATSKENEDSDIHKDHKIAMIPRNMWESYKLSKIEQLCAIDIFWKQLQGMKKLESITQINICGLTRWGIGSKCWRTTMMRKHDMSWSVLPLSIINHGHQNRNRIKWMKLSDCPHSTGVCWKT